MGACHSADNENECGDGITKVARVQHPVTISISGVRNRPIDN